MPLIYSDSTGVIIFHRHVGDLLRSKRTCRDYHPVGKRVNDHGYFLGTYRNGNLSQSSGHVLLGDRCGRILVPLPTSFLEVVELLGLYNIIRPAGYDPVLCLFGLRRS